MGLKAFIGAICIIAFAIITFTGCSSSSSGGSAKYENKDVQYSINGYEITTNADGVVERTKNNVIWKDLYWGCGNYKGLRDRHVSLLFKMTESTWDFQTAIISPGNCE